jgi:Zn-dependent protease
MFGSLKLGKIFGIDVYIHGTFWLLPLFVFLNGVFLNDALDAAFEVVVLFGIFGCIVLHETGHALAARAFGIGTRDITLYPMGGIASLERMPERPGREIAIALAGPAVNFAIVLGLIAAAFLGDYATPAAWTSGDANLVDLFLGQILVANLFLGVFNLIPAFPMDGGRVLRAVLSFGMTRLEATRIAVGVGSVLAIAGGIYGLLPPASFSLVLVAVVVYLMGRAELASVERSEERRDSRRWFDVVDDHGNVHRVYEN